MVVVLVDQVETPKLAVIGPGSGAALDRGAEPLADDLGLAGVGRRQQEHELLAAVARDQVVLAGLLARAYWQLA